MLILSVILLLISTLILAIIPLTLDKLIDKKELELNNIDVDQNKMLNDIKTSSYSGQNFSILQNQFKILQEINPKSQNLQSLLLELVTSKIQITGAALNTVQQSGIITQEEYNEFNARINAPFDYVKFNESFENLHIIHQNLIRQIENGLNSLQSNRAIKEIGLKKTKTFNTLIILTAILFNSCSILIGAYITINEKDNSNIESELKDIKKEVQDGFQVIEKERNLKSIEYNKAIDSLKYKVDSISLGNKKWNK